MTRCDFRSYGECGCPADACAVQKPVTQAPVFMPSLKTQAITCLFLGFVAAIISAAVMEERLKFTDLDNQEVHHVSR